MGPNFMRNLFPTSVRQRRRPQYGYSPPAAYVRQRRRLQYGYGPTATYVRMWLWYISNAVSERLSTVKYEVCEKMPHSQCTPLKLLIPFYPLIVHICDLCNPCSLSK